MPRICIHLQIAVFLGYVHTKPDKFENATFATKPDKMFSVHINRFQKVPFLDTENTVSVWTEGLSG